MAEALTSFFAATPVRWWDVVDILIVAFLVYELLQFIRGTHAVQIALGGLVLVVLYWASILFNLQTVNWLLRTFLPFLVFGIIVGFIWEWLRETHIRSEASRRAGEVARLEREVGALRDQHKAPRDEVLAILDGQKTGNTLPAPR